MRSFFRLQTLLWALYALAIFLIYQLIVKIAFLEGSWIALLVFVPVLLASFWLIRREERKPVTVFSIGFLLLDHALTTLDRDSLVWTIFGTLIAAAVIALLAKWYGKLRWNAVIVLVLIALVTNFSFNRDNLAVLNHFYIKWESDKLYQGEWVDYFPMTLYDVNHDGIMEIVTYGNIEEAPPFPDPNVKPETEEEKQALADQIVRLKAEPVSLYVFSMENGKAVRLPNNSIAPEDLAMIKEQMPVDYPGFPYFTAVGDQLVPNVQRQPYTEAMMQFGTAPYHAFLLDMLNVEELFKQNQGQSDHRKAFAHPSKFSNLSIEAGVLSGIYDGKAFQTPTKATKLLDTMRLPGGQEGLMLLGEDMSVLTVQPDGTTAEPYVLKRKMINGLATSDLIVADIDHDGIDELMVANTPSYILKPTADGKWDILWISNHNDKSFRFNNFAQVGTSAQPEIIASAKSWVSNHYLRYLTGFTFKPDGLEQNWRIYLPLINVRVGDIDGDKQNEIVASIFNKHRILVLKQHNVPVMPIVIAITVVLYAYAVVRRFRHASK